MTEAEWLICARPASMLVHLQKHFGFHVLRRKIRLFICACRRLGWELSTAPDERVALEVAERFADGQVTHAERDAVRWKLIHDYSDFIFIPGGFLRPTQVQRRLLNQPQGLTILACERDKRVGPGAMQAAASLVQAWTEAALGPNANERPGSEWKQFQAKHRKTVSYFLRDIFGNPFRTFSVEARWLEWNGRIVPRLAQAIYDEYAFDRLPILADALEEAGCTDLDVLNHCRQPAEHVRGCWVVDLLLGKD